MNIQVPKPCNPVALAFRFSSLPVFTLTRTNNRYVFFLFSCASKLKQGSEGENDSVSENEVEKREKWKSWGRMREKREEREKKGEKKKKKE